jgi:hypothetical protein
MINSGHVFGAMGDDEGGIMSGTWQQLSHQPSFGAGTMLLLTDGTVLAFQSNGKEVWKLAPDQSGNYVNGTWTQLASMAHTRLYFASAVLADGRVLVAGGEYSDAGSDTKDCQVYNPVLNQWATINAPAGWTAVGDAPCSMLPDGRVLLGSIGTTATAVFDPATDAFTAAAAKDDASSEETWTLLPDETVLSVECRNHPKAEKYVIAADKWVSAGTLPVDLVQASSIEIGPAILMTDGRLFAIGATGNTAVYTPPPVANQVGAWASGPVFPNDAAGKPLEAKDAPACLMPNGKVLCTAAPAGEGGSYPSGTRFFEYDGSHLNEITGPVNATGPAYVGRMLLLPTGQVLYADGSKTVSVYSPDGAAQEDWRPEITDYPHHIRAKQTYTLRGRLLNGLSQACSYGDDATMATNYPIVRLVTAGGHVVYCRTFDHSTMGVATGQAIESTQFKVPLGVPNGPAELCVIANGISSDCVPVHLGPYRIQVPITGELVAHLIGSLADGDLWVLGPNGPVPVDPWGPDIARQAKTAWAQVIAGAEELIRLGNEITAAPREASNPEPAAPSKPKSPHAAALV